MPGTFNNFECTLGWPGSGFRLGATRVLSGSYDPNSATAAYHAIRARLGDRYFRTDSTEWKCTTGARIDGTNQNLIAAAVWTQV